MYFTCEKITWVFGASHVKHMCYFCKGCVNGGLLTEYQILTIVPVLNELHLIPNDGLRITKIYTSIHTSKTILKWPPLLPKTIDIKHITHQPESDNLTVFTYLSRLNIFTPRTWTSIIIGKRFTQLAYTILTLVNVFYKTLGKFKFGHNIARLCCILSNLHPPLSVGIC